MSSDQAEEQRAQEAVRRHGRTRAFAGAQDVISFVMSDPQAQQARAQIDAAETELGVELRARLQPFQDRYDQPCSTATQPSSQESVRASTAAGDGSASWTTATRPRWRNRDGAATARGSRSCG
ncbi:hypothetical protein [Streptomyces sp. NBC_00057]|uniref:hypothetical protein n=1 Tax=Streptomyces sp. NBC_00057 TaxID=2975634 RepID=UPI0032452EEB